MHERVLADIASCCQARYLIDMLTFLLWAFATLLAAVYCIIKAIIDLRARRYAWGILGLASAAVFLLAPIQTHAVKMDLPPPAN